jgi:hypothetical protein
MLSLMLILVVGALVAAIVAAMGKCPLWVAVILLALAVGLQVLPVK